MKHLKQYDNQVLNNCISKICTKACDDKFKHEMISSGISTVPASCYRYCYLRTWVLILHLINEKENNAFEIGARVDIISRAKFYRNS